MMTQNEIENLQNKARKQLKNGASLFGKDGAFAPMLKKFLEQSLEVAMETHLSKKKRALKNKRNGKRPKTIKSSAGTFTILTPKDRQSTLHSRKCRRSPDPISPKMGGKYPIVIASWQHNWEKLSTYFEYTEPICKLIYTTNPIEGYHRQIRRVTKTKGAFTSDMARLKLVYLATKNIEKNGICPCPIGA